MGGQQSSGKSAVLCGLILDHLACYSQNQEVGTRRPVRNIVQHDPRAEKVVTEFAGEKMRIEELMTKEKQIMTESGFSAEPVNKIFKGKKFVSNTQFTDTPGIVQEQSGNLEDATL